MSVLVLLMAAAVAGADAPPQAPPAGQAPPAATPGKPAPDPDKMVCRNEPVTGSRFDKRVCMTQAQWDQKAAEAQTFSRIQDQRSGSVGHASSPF